MVGVIKIDIIRESVVNYCIILEEYPRQKFEFLGELPALFLLFKVHFVKFLNFSLFACIEPDGEKL